MKKVNNNLDTPTIINSIVDFLQDPNCKKMHETFEKTKDPAAILSHSAAEVSGFHNPPTTGGSSFLANQGGTVTIINPSNFIRLPVDAVAAAATTDGNIPVVVKEAVAEVRDEQQLPLSVVQASRKRTIMTRSLSRQASQIAEVKEEIEEEEDSDSDYTPEPVAKKSRASAGAAAGPTSSRMRSTAGRKPNSAKGDGLDHLPPDERDKVRMRRQKNKEAAARCRQKRVDLTNSLAKQVEEEQASKAKLQQEIRRLRQEHDKLRRQLEAHKAYGCNMLATAAAGAPPVTTTTTQATSYHQVAAAVPVAVKSQPVIVEAANAPYTTAVSLSSHASHQPLTKPRRPQTLGLSQQQQLTTAATAVTSDKAQIKLEEQQLETPSKMIAPLFDGFTPTSIFGNIPTLGTPTACSVQQLHRAGAACDDLTTPSDLTCSLTAL